MSYHIRLTNALSYFGMNGGLKATKKNPDVFVEDKATADAAVASGFFLFIGEQNTPPSVEVPGHLDPAQLESMTVPNLKKLAADMGVDIKECKDKAAIVAAIAAQEVTPSPAFDAEELVDMSDEELEALAEEKGIDLTGCETREDILEAISVALGGSYTMLDILRD